MANDYPKWDYTNRAWYDRDGNLVERPAPSQPPPIPGKYLSYENRTMQRQEQAAAKLQKAAAAVAAEAAAEGVPNPLGYMQPKWETFTPKPEMTALEISMAKLDAAAAKAAEERDAAWGSTIDYADIRREEAERLQKLEREAELRTAMGIRRDGSRL